MAKTLTKPNPTHDCPIPTLTLQPFFLNPKIFLDKNFLDQIFFEHPKTLLNQRFFQTQKILLDQNFILDPNFLWTQVLVGPKKNRNYKNDQTLNFEDPKFLESKMFL